MCVFVEVFDVVFMVLVENSGLNFILILVEVKSQQVKFDVSWGRFGVDCMGCGDNDMKEVFVIDFLIGKKQ